MFNANQIKKLQKKVAVKVDSEIKAREEKERQEKRDREDRERRRILPHLIEMRREIQSLQNENSDRGACFALWEGQFYLLHPKKNKVETVVISIQDRMTFDEPIKEVNGKRYYFIQKSIYDNQKKILTFFSNHYATIKMGVNKFNSTSRESIYNYLALGGIFEEFQKEFPESSMVDFVNAYRAFENFFLESLKFA